MQDFVKSGRQKILENRKLANKIVQIDKDFRSKELKFDPATATLKNVTSGSGTTTFFTEMNRFVCP